MSDSETPALDPVAEWMTTGQSLYSAMLSECHKLEAQMSEVKGRMQEKGRELSQIATLLRTPLTRPHPAPAPADPPEERIVEESLRLMARSRCGFYRG